MSFVFGEYRVLAREDKRTPTQTHVNEPAASKDRMTPAHAPSFLAMIFNVSVAIYTAVLP